MNLLDLLIGIPLLWGAYRGLKRGFIFEIFMIAGLILGLYAAFKFSSLMNDFISRSVSADSAVIPYLSFLIVFSVIMLVMILFARVLENILKVTALNAFNKIAGAALGVIKFALVISVLLWSLKSLEPYWNFINPTTKQQSLLYAPVMKTASFLSPAFQDIKEQFNKKLK